MVKIAEKQSQWQAVEVEVVVGIIPPKPRYSSSMNQSQKFERNTTRLTFRLQILTSRSTVSIMRNELCSDQVGLTFQGGTLPMHVEVVDVH